MIILTQEQLETILMKETTGLADMIDRYIEGAEEFSGSIEDYLAETQMDEQTLLADFELFVQVMTEGY